ncbi:ATPase [Acinetobacter sp. ANC 4470]|uniref:SRPBCC family protein n=1 Tax=Acinetobacter sp. ANC 4470 TaxID=1977881 RepID=UPI000A34DC36|nr:SRPBCC domain-containing protein [Acinetobacter sp. ANC 4470]OTG69255.1 ATPase [Acinetobacter sp. ANC 4470]
MEILNYEILIHASPEKVWQVLWDSKSYTQWTQYFSPGSTMHSDWTVDGRTVFLDANGDGMVSTINQLDEFKVVAFKHLGMLQDGVEDLDSEEVKKWSGALEKYFLEGFNGKTKLRVELETTQEYLEMMVIAFKKGFEQVKLLAEA